MSEIKQVKQLYEETVIAALKEFDIQEVGMARYKKNLEAQEAYQKELDEVIRKTLLGKDKKDERKKELPSVSIGSYVVYALELEGNRYFIGRTKDLDAKLYKLHEAEGFPLHYRIIKLVETWQDGFGVLHFHLKQYMLKYGVSNVRGGAYTSKFLSPEQIRALQREIDFDNHCCFICHQPAHKEATCMFRVFCSQHGWVHKKSPCKNPCPRCGGHTHAKRGCTELRRIDTGETIIDKVSLKPFVKSKSL